MPRGNGMGPMGMGPQTGRAAGFCAGNGQPGFMKGAGGGARGMGRGCRNMFIATGLPGWMRAGGNTVPAPAMGKEASKEALKNYAATLQSELDLANKRLSEIETN